MYFIAKILTGLWDPLGCLDLSQKFFGSSPTVVEWDKIVAEIINTTFVFLGHPTPHPPPTRKLNVSNISAVTKPILTKF